LAAGSTGDFIQQELKSQIEFLLDHGISPTHLNAHQYVDTFSVVASLIPALLHRMEFLWSASRGRGLTQSTLIHRLEPLNWCLGQSQGPVRLASWV